MDVKQIIQDFELYSGGDRLSWAEEIASDLEFVNNVQWSAENSNALEANNIPPVVYNEMKPARDQSTQQLTHNNPQFLAVARENSDTQLAADVSDFMSYIWDKSNGRMHFIKAVENFEDGGLFCLQAYFDPYADWGKGEIKICHRDLRDIYIDPRSTKRNGEDASKIFVAYVNSESQVKRQYPNFDLKKAHTHKGELRQKGNGKSNQGQVFVSNFMSRENYYRIIDQYEKIKYPMFRVYDPQSDFEALYDEKEYMEFSKKPALIVNKIGSQIAVTDKREIQEWIQRIEENQINIFHLMTDGSWMPGVEHEGSAKVSPDGQLIIAIPGSTVKVDITNNLQLLQEGLIKYENVLVDRIKETLLIGDTLYGEKILPISRYPFGLTMLHHTDTPFCYGDARLARPIQEQINKARSLITAYNINIASLKLFVPEGTDLGKLESEWGKAGAQFFTYDPELGGIPIALQFQQMANGLYDQIDRDKFLIQRIYGVYEFQDGAMQGAPQTKGGTILVDEFGQRRSLYKRMFIEQALDDLASVISEMIPRVYDEKKIIRIVKPNSRPKEIIFNNRIDEHTIINDLTANEYDIKLVSGSTLPTHRGARLEMALNFWDRGILKDNEPILRLSDLPDIDELIKRNSVLMQAEQMLGQMQEQIKNLAGDKQTTDRENLHLKQKVEVEKTKVKLNELTNEIKGNVNLAKMRVNDAVKQKQKEVSESKSQKEKKNG